MGIQKTFMATTTVRDSPSIAPPARQLTLLERLTSFPALLAALLAGGLFVPLRDFTVDPDVWWHIKVGESILGTHRWPTMDTYSFTAQGAPWMAYEWLGEVLLAAVNRAWGFQGLMALNAALGAAVVLGLYALATLRSRNSKASFVACGLLLYLTAVSFSLRPQMLGYLFLILTLLILERFRQGRARMLWLLPLVFLAWVNTHPTFMIGLFIFGVFAISGMFNISWGGVQSAPWTPAQRIRLGLVFSLSLIALAVTPYGVKLVGNLVEVGFVQPINLSGILEWQPIPLNTTMGKLFLAILAGFLLAQVVLRLSWQLVELSLFFVGIVATCLHVRFLMLFVPFCAAPLAMILSRWVPPYDPRIDRHALNALLMIAVVVGVVRFFPSRAQLERSVDRNYPVKAVQHLEQHPPPVPMFNTYGYGGYLIYALDGRNEVFIDGRVEIYDPPGVLRDYTSIAGLAPNALFLLRAYNVQSCLIRRDEALATLLTASSEWRKIYADDLSVLFVRSQTGK